jgi:hypothetical protein
MAKIEVAIVGASTDASFTWDGAEKPLTRSNQKWTCSFDDADGQHYYMVAVKGPPGEEWSATIKGGDDTVENKHRSKMNPQGSGHTGLVGFIV